MANQSHQRHQISTFAMFDRTVVFMHHRAQNTYMGINFNKCFSCGTQHNTSTHKSAGLLSSMHNWTIYKRIYFKYAFIYNSNHFQHTVYYNVCNWIVTGRTKLIFLWSVNKSEYKFLALAFLTARMKWLMGYSHHCSLHYIIKYIPQPTQGKQNNIVIEGIYTWQLLF